MKLPEELIDHLEHEINIGNVDKKVQNLILLIFEENKKHKEIIDKAIKELFNLKDMIYRPESREENVEIQRKISSIITDLKGNNSKRGGINE